MLQSRPKGALATSKRERTYTKTLAALYHTTIEAHIRRRWKLQHRRRAYIIDSQSIALRLQSAKDESGIWMKSGSEDGRLEVELIRQTRQPANPWHGWRRLCVFPACFHTWLRLLGQTKACPIIQIDLQITQGVHIQGHWIITLFKNSTHQVFTRQAIF